MNRLVGWFLALVLAFSVASPVAAQGGADACPVLVESALDLAAESCARLDRNEVCYGNTQVAATGWDAVSLPDFAVPGDTASVLDLASIETAALSVEQNQWGVAVMALQADLPGTLPGQDVTFVLFGDAELRSEVPLVEGAAPPQTCAAMAAGGLNVRGGPGTDSPVVGGLAAGEQIILTGRNPAGDWVVFEADEQAVWAYAPLLDMDCDLPALPVVAESAGSMQYTAPMQAFYLRTGAGSLACNEAPRDGLLVQSPAQTVVHFRINGVDVAVGSTVLFQTRGMELIISTLEGSASAASGGVTITVRPGQRAVVTAGNPPADPEPFEPEAVRHTPVELLPKQVSLPLPAVDVIRLVGCAGGEVTIPASKSVVVVALGWASADRAHIDSYASVANLSATYDGVPLTHWSRIGPTSRSLTIDGETKEGWMVDDHWTISNLQPGRHEIVGRYEFGGALFEDIDYDGNGQLDPVPGSSFSCTLIVTP